MNDYYKNEIYTLVGKSFDEKVSSRDKDVLVKFYVPWCGHCEALAQEYEKVLNNLPVGYCRITIISIYRNNCLFILLYLSHFILINCRIELCYNTKNCKVILLLFI